MAEIKLIIDSPKLLVKGTKTTINNEVLTEAENPWDAAHNYRSTRKLKDFYVEPEIDQNIYEIEKLDKLILKSTTPHYLKNWPKPPAIKNHFVWHLLDDYSQLKQASEKVWNKIEDKKQEEKRIKIAHIDTGFQPNHPALPEFLNPGISFVKGEEGKSAVDTTTNSFGEQEGHGTATMSILAGRKVFFNKLGVSYEGSFGGIPFAEIIPIRISDTVALIRSQNFVKAINYAIEQGCEVVSMSMAGAPTREWANAVNEAYRKGITIVTAAGNSWNKGAKKLLPKRLLYPARWERVIAATGVTSNQYPYIFDAQLGVKSEGGENMQGNYGPKKVMKNALAAYTPNTPWATMNEADQDILFRFDGGGTSSSTPQVAAAAALWLSYYRDEINAQITSEDDLWKKVEAVKYALYTSADKTTYNQWEKYYGKGILKAAQALNEFPDFNTLERAKKARATLNGIADFLGIMLRLKDDSMSKEEEITREMFSTEILQELHNNPDLHKYLDTEDDAFWTNSQKQDVIQHLLKSPNTSNNLKNFIKTL
ncbi:S8/S53 family peptidase [Lacinutrix sp. C3R15]|uniref:S8 family peptidase n=1 Tax=Flavobacteriaceae TaxID=49546 RepID=UPI001C09330E|nr:MULTISPECIES: S8/S53 family peptidase [Flavobacteriaceae]MBU2938528.1 S8/S53 family peptidase [Lacinutrix sp. C3R15]MDO6621842.1 S8/S53 family peptidase [Oceanihabitans sp. 1_MG-2023]